MQLKYGKFKINFKRFLLQSRGIFRCKYLFISFIISIREKQFPNNFYIKRMHDKNIGFSFLSFSTTSHSFLDTFSSAK